MQLKALIIGILMYQALEQAHTHYMFNRQTSYRARYLLNRIKEVRATKAGPFYPKG
jgi:hypothetical protein